VNATDALRRDHDVILRVLEALDRVATAVETGGAAPKGMLPSAIEFVRGFADGCHHAKEERLLFPLMKEHGVPEQGGPIGVMLHEHETGREYIRLLEQGVEQDDRSQIIEALRGYVSLLREHIAKENDVLFAIADQVLDADEQERLAAEFERIDQEQFGTDARQRFVTLAGELERALS
jgi:hemerythrin-like domain-containing protein